MNVLFEALDLSGVTGYLRRRIGLIPQIRRTALERGDDFPTGYQHEVVYCLARFLKLAREKKNELSSRELYEWEGELALSLYFIILDAQKILDVLEDDIVPSYKRMRNINDEDFCVLAYKLRILLSLLVL